jgi:hypothetical protein
MDPVIISAVRGIGGLFLIFVGTAAMSRAWKDVSGTPLMFGIGSVCLALGIKALFAA